jgi:D-inositol-3-phosphate glycosyltransferase
MLTPSHSESFGLVALEAQACGTPVVAARVGGLRTVVKDGVSGVLVDGHDPADWARAIRRLVRAPGLLRELSAGALRHASAFGWSATVDRLAKVYTNAMDEAAASRRSGPQYPTGPVRWEGDGIGHAARVGA